MKTHPINFVLTSALIVGSLDLLLAFANAWWSSGMTPANVLRYVASGLMGEQAFSKADPIVIPIGLCIHYFIAFFWTTIFLFVYGSVKKLIHQKFIIGILYGLFVWIVMNLIVLPLTSVPPFELKWMSAIKGASILILAIGLPLAYLADRRYNK